MRFELLAIRNGEGRREYELSVYDICSGQNICRLRFYTRKECKTKIAEYLRKYWKEITK